MKDSYTWEEYLTVGKLRDLLNDLPDDMPVFYQHIDDSYMWKGGGWIDNAARVRDPQHSLKNGDAWTDEWLHRAYAAFKVKTTDDVEVLEITAHY